MKFARSVFALLALVTVSACAAMPQVAAPLPAQPVIAPLPAPAVTDGKVTASSEDLSALPRSYVVYFDTNSAEIRASTMQVLWEAAQNATKLKPLTIRVQGFTDGAGKMSYNQHLSERRAAAVAAQLGKLGIGIKVEAIGLGETTGNRKDARSRRVEITFEGSAVTAALPLPAQAVQVALGDDAVTAIHQTAIAPVLMAAPQTPVLDAVSAQRAAERTVIHAVPQVTAATGPPLALG